MGHQETTEIQRLESKGGHLPEAREPKRLKSEKRLIPVPRVVGPDKNAGHLGHFANPEVLREGHNRLPTQAKAKEILRHGKARGRSLSRKQKGFLGLIAGGGRPTRMKKR